MLSWVGNGKCDSQNNRPECQYDGGDCCLKTCVDNCDAKRKNGTVDNCTFVCGAYGYDCKDPEAGCGKCSANGVCRP